MIVLINTFEIQPGKEDAFFEAWKRASEVMEARPGFIHTRLHRATTGARFVNVAEWESMEAFAAAINSPEFREAAAPLRELGKENPALYQVVYEAGTRPMHDRERRSRAYYEGRARDVLQ